MCGVIGIISFLQQNVTPHIGGALCSMSYRGDQASGLAATETAQLTQPTRLWKRGGDPRAWLRNPLLAGPIIDEHPGDIAIGHNRYATSSKAASTREAQPGYADWLGNSVYICSNGDLPFCADERQQLCQLGAHSAKFATEGDSEVIAKLIATRILHQRMSATEAFLDVGKHLNGTFSLVSIVNDPTGKRLYVMRDRFGNRPLWVAVWSGKLLIACSETAVIQELIPVIGEPCDELYPLPPGALLVASPSGDIQTYSFGNGRCSGFCLMELFYFAGRVSYFEGCPRSDQRGWLKYGQIRRMLGKQLAREWRAAGLPIPDFVCGVPDSGEPAGQGCAAGLGVPYFSVVDKNRSAAGRNFQGISGDRVRDIRGKMWLNEDVDGCTIAVVDDSVIRAEQSTIISSEKLREDDLMICRGLREEGAKQVIFASTAPPYIYPCFYGLNTPDPSRLAARGKSVEEVKKIIGANFLIYLSLEGTLEVVRQSRDFFCTACFTGEYLGTVPDGRPEV